ncbi:hypothetical protein GCM10009430_17950 [Aquimarina litoralis]|uniref:Uncharacterized protein n=1 Tax=Aquimarina litoralis TaxID=584605 RepID=A0ABN1IQ99_9FLAO
MANCRVQIAKRLHKMFFFKSGIFNICTVLKVFAIRTIVSKVLNNSTLKPYTFPKYMLFIDSLTN